MVTQQIRVLSQPLVYVAAGKFGQGVFARSAMGAENILGSVEGQLIDDAEFESNYGIDMGGEVTLDPQAPFRFLNHSCDPNAELVGLVRHAKSGETIVVVTLRKIAADEEVTIDYGWPIEAAQQCACQTLNCRGVIGGGVAT